MPNDSAQPEHPNHGKLAKQRLTATYIALFTIAAICAGIPYRLKATGVDTPTGTATALICTAALFGVPGLHILVTGRFPTVHHFIFTSIGAGSAATLAMFAIISRYT